MLSVEGVDANTLKVKSVHVACSCYLGLQSYIHIWAILFYEVIDSLTLIFWEGKALCVSKPMKLTQNQYVLVLP